MIEWSPELDALVAERRSRGDSFGDIGTAIGKSRNAVLGRYYRRQRRLFPSQLRRKEQEAAAVRRNGEKRQAKVHHDGEILAAMKENLTAGMDRGQAFRLANELGVTYQAIGDVCRITRERVRQVINGSSSLRFRSE